MRVLVDKTTGEKTIYIHDGESEPTGIVLDGTAPIQEGDTLINSDTKILKKFNGTSWIKWLEIGGE